jgi:hypothetical protein
MKRYLLNTLLICVAFLFGSSGAWAYTPTLSDSYKAPGYKTKAFYNIANNNVDDICPPFADKSLSFRGGGYGLFNYGSGNRNADITLSVSKGDLVIFEFKDTQNRSVTINSVSDCTANALYSSGDYKAFDVTKNTTTVNVDVGRAGCIIAILVMENDPDAPKADFTIDYKDESNNLVKSTSGNTVIGLSVPAENSFWVEDVKYINDNGGSFEIGETNNNFNVTVRQAAKYAWTAKSNVGNYTISGETLEGEKANAKYPLYVLSDGKLWTKPATNKEFNASFDVPSNNYEYELTYSETEFDAIFYVEAEDVNGMTIINSGNAEARSSQRAAGYAASSNVVFTTLAPGKYKLVGSYYSPSSGGGHPTIYTGNRIIVEATTNNANSTTFEGEFVVAKESNEIAFGKGGGNTAAFDYVYIQKLADATADELAEALAEDEKADTRVVLDNEITKAKALYNEDLYGADVFNAAITAAEEARDADDATTDSYNAAIETLKEAEEIFKLGAPTTHTVNLVDDKENVIGTTSANGFENDESVEVTYPKYIKVGDTLYAAEPDATTKSFRKTLSLVGETEPTIAYTATSIVGVTMLQEGEDLTLNGYQSNWANRGQGDSEGVAYSDDQVARLGTSSSAYTNPVAEAGFYSVMVGGHNRMESEASSLELGLRDAQGTITPIETQLTWNGGESAEKNLAEVEMTAGSSLVFFNKKTNYTSEIEIDYVYIKNRGDKHTYMLKAVSNDEALDSLLAEGYGFANDEAIMVPYPRYINVDGTLYESATTNHRKEGETKDNKQYRKKVTFEEDRVIEVSYTKTDKDRVIFHKEAEQIEGMTAVSNEKNVSIRCSNALGAFAEDNVKLTSLEPGQYKITAAVYGNAGTLLAFTVNNDTVWTGVTSNYLPETDSVLVLKEAADLMIAKGGGGGSSPKVLDYIFIQSVPNTYTYAVKAAIEGVDLDSVLVEGEAIEGTLIEAAYPRFMNIDSVLYESQPTDEGKYMTSFTLNDNMVVPVDYAKTRIDKVVFLKEALKLDGKQEAELTDLTPGYYKLTATVTGTDGAVVVVADNDTVWTATNDGTIQNEEAEFELTADTKLNIANGGEAEATVDYLYVQVAEKPIEPEPEPETDHVNFVELDHVKSTAENPEAGIVSDPIALSQGSHVAAADDESGLSLWDAEDGAELRAAVGKSFFITPPEGKALREVILKGRKLNLKASNGKLSETEPEVVEEPEVNQNPENGNEEEVAAARKKVEEAPLVVEEPLVEGEPEAEEPAADEEETLYWTGNIDKVKFTAEAETAISSIIVISAESDENTETYTEPVEPEPEPIDTLLAEAKTLLGDSTGVAAGKLIEAIDAYEQVEEKQDADKEALAAAMAQYEKDNEAQENDQTAKVKTDGWKKYDGTNAGVCATQYAPAIDTYDGRKDVKLAEVYESTVATTGTIIYQDITGLQNGTYKVGFYGNAFFTSGRGFDSDMADGAEDVAYVFANDQKEFIVSKIATETTENNFRTFDVEVTDGAIKLGMGKEKPGTNWHTMQIYQLTWIASAKEVYANDLAALKAAIEEAKAEQANELKTEGKEALADAIEAAEAAAESNMLNISELEAEVGKLAQAINDFQTANLVTFEGKYYIQNVASGKFMAAGHNWGTRGIVNETGLDLTLTADDNKKVTIDSRVANNETNHFLGSNLYMDAGAFGWTIEKLSDDSYAIGDGTKYLTIDADDNLTLADEGASWKFVAAETLEAERLAANMATLAAATKDNGVDATFLIKTPQFNRNDQRNADNWTVSEDCTNKNLGGGSNDTQFNGCAESYHSTFTISQLVAGAPKGTYRMTAQGFYRQDGDSAETTPLFFMNDATAEVPAKTGSENSMAEAGSSFTAGEYTIDPIEVFVGEGATLTVGIKNETAKNQWIIFDNFRLTYFGEEDSTTPKLPKYTVNEVIDGQVVRTTEGEAELGTTVKVPYRHYNVVDGKLYSKGVTSKEYNYSFKFETDGQEENITGYTATGTQDIVFLSEGEDIEGLTPCTSGNTAIRSSNSASAYAADADVEITKLPAGTYKLTAAIFDASKTPNSMWYFIAGTDTIAKLNCTKVNYQECISEKFTLEAETSIMLAKGGNANMGIDLVYIQAVEAETPIFSYTVNEVANGQTVRTTEGTAEKASVVKVPFREYNVFDGKLYKKAQINKEFNYSFTLNNDKQTENLEYEATETENVVFLKEGEDIEGLTKITTGNTAIRSSNSASAYAAEGNVEFVTLPAGVYKLTAGIYDANKTPDSHWKFLAGETEIADLNCTTVNIQELTSDEFTLTEETKLYIGQGGASNMGIDFIYIVKTGEATPDGISAIKAAAEKGAVYDMQGRKQSGKLRKGLYIMDGKVISVK